MHSLNISEQRQRFRESVEYHCRYKLFAGTVYKLKEAKFQMLSMRKVFTLSLQNIKHLRIWSISTQMPSLKYLWAEAKISKIGWISLEILDFCWHSVQVESGKISNVVDAESFRHAIPKVKYLRGWNLTPKRPPSISLSWGKDFENRLNIFGDIGFLLAQCTGWKWENFKCCWCGKFSPCHSKSKIFAQLKLYTQTPTLKIFELRQRLRKSFEYLWRYWIFAGTVYRLKMAKFQILFDAERFRHAIPKVKYLRGWNFTPKRPPSISLSWGKDFENRLNIFGDIGFLLAQCTGWKWQNFKCCWCAKFSPCHCKSKIPALLKLCNQIHSLNIFEQRQRFRKSVEYRWRYRIFAGTVYRLKVAKFQLLSIRKVFTLSLQN